MGFSGLRNPVARINFNNGRCKRSPQSLSCHIARTLKLYKKRRYNHNEENFLFFCLSYDLPVRCFTNNFIYTGLACQYFLKLPKREVNYFILIDTFPNLYSYFWLI